MTNTQARLIAAGLALVAAAILSHAMPQSSTVPWVLFLTGAMFVVEYGRASVPERGGRSERQSD